MKQVIFWGTRGSLPVALAASDVQQKILYALRLAREQHLSSEADLQAFVQNLPFEIGATFGGNSSCVELVTGEAAHFICDMGSGARQLGRAKLARYGKPRPQTYHIFLSHLHWDHLMGLPFFEPLYIPGNQIIIHGCHQRLEEAVRLQLRTPGFPVDYSQLKANIHYDYMVPGEPYYIGAVKVSAMLQNHPGDSFAYRFEVNNKTVVYATDAEHSFEQLEMQEKSITFFRQADLVIFDAMYSLADVTTHKAGWGHSCNVIGAELCLAAGVKKLALFHHDPTHDDLQLCRLLEETRRFVALSQGENQLAATLQVVSAYDGLNLTI